MAERELGLIELLDFMERRLAALREERERTGETVKRGGTLTGDYLSSMANSVSRNVGGEHELQILLRIAHGMNPNGSWPHPAGTCTQCGRPTVQPGDPAGLCSFHVPGGLHAREA